MCMIAGILVMFNLIGPLSVSQALLSLPIAVQEMVLAVWLIVKGFNPNVISVKYSKDILIPRENAAFPLGIG